MKNLRNRCQDNERFIYNIQQIQIDLEKKVDKNDEIIKNKILESTRDI